MWGKALPDERFSGHDGSLQTCGRGREDACDSRGVVKRRSHGGASRGEEKSWKPPRMRVKGREGDRGSSMEASWEGREGSRVEGGEGRQCGDNMRASNQGEKFLLILHIRYVLKEPLSTLYR